jgi:hypothetical protein
MSKVEAMFPPCCVCGKPSTHAVRDSHQLPVRAGDRYDSYRTGEVRAGCAEHRQLSKVYDSNGQEIVGSPR